MTISERPLVEQGIVRALAAQFWHERYFTQVAADRCSLSVSALGELMQKKTPQRDYYAPGESVPARSEKNPFHCRPGVKLQAAIEALVAAGLIVERPSGKGTRVVLTPSGARALGHEEIAEALEQNRLIPAGQRLSEPAVVQAARPVVESSSPEVEKARKGIMTLCACFPTALKNNAINKADLLRLLSAPRIAAFIIGREGVNQIENPYHSSPEIIEKAIDEMVTEGFLKPEPTIGPKPGIRYRWGRELTPNQTAERPRGMYMLQIIDPEKPNEPPKEPTR